MAKKKPINPWDMPTEEIKKEAKKIKKEVESSSSSPIAKEIENKTVIVRVRESYKNRAKAKASRQGITMQEYLENLIDEDDAT